MLRKGSVKIGTSPPQPQQTKYKRLVFRTSPTSPSSLYPPPPPTAPPPTQGMQEVAPLEEETRKHATGGAEPALDTSGAESALDTSGAMKQYGEETGGDEQYYGSDYEAAADVSTPQPWQLLPSGLSSKQRIAISPPQKRKRTGNILIQRMPRLGLSSLSQPLASKGPPEPSKAPPKPSKAPPQPSQAPPQPSKAPPQPSKSNQPLRTLLSGRLSKERLPSHRPLASLPQKRSPAVSGPQASLATDNTTSSTPSHSDDANSDDDFQQVRSQN